MRIHYLQHAAFEDLANIELWAKDKGHVLSKTQFYNNIAAPSIDSFDWLIIMGGPMNVYETDKYPWLNDEKKLIGESIQKGKLILGICLGAQLIADVMGAKVYKNPQKEIGWMPVELTQCGKNSKIFAGFPDSFEVFQWHGDTFDIPAGCRHLAKSAACANQTFCYEDRVVGLQFHLESSRESVAKLVENCACELIAGKHIQTKDDILSVKNNYNELYFRMSCMLSALEMVEER